MRKTYKKKIYPLTSVNSVSLLSICRYHLLPVCPGIFLELFGEALLSVVMVGMEESLASHGPSDRAFKEPTLGDVVLQVTAHKVRP